LTWLVADGVHLSANALCKHGATNGVRQSHRYLLMVDKHRGARAHGSRFVGRVRFRLGIRGVIKAFPNLVAELLKHDRLPLN